MMNIAKILGCLIIGASIIAGFYIRNSFVSVDTLLSSVSVEGKAEQEIQADVISLTVTSTNTCDKVEEAVKLSKEAKKKFAEIMADCGLTRDSDYFFRPRTVEQMKATDSGHDMGKATQEYTIKTSNINAAEKAEKAIEALASSGMSIAVTDITYEVKDKDPIERSLLGQAIIDAREKAMQIAKHAGCKLIGAPTICYSNIQLRDKNASKDSWSWRGASSRDLTAYLTLSVSYKMSQ
jgi:hypothetical protein